LSSIDRAWATNFKKNDTFLVAARFPEKLYLLLWSDDRFKNSTFSINFYYKDRHPDYGTEYLENIEYLKRKSKVDLKIEKSKS